MDPDLIVSDQKKETEDPDSPCEAHRSPASPGRRSALFCCRKDKMPIELKSPILKSLSKQVFSTMLSVGMIVDSYHHHREKEFLRIRQGTGRSGVDISKLLNDPRRFPKYIVAEFRGLWPCQIGSYSYQLTISSFHFLSWGGL